MRLVFAHADRVVLERAGRALDQDDPGERAVTTLESDAPAEVAATDAMVAFATVEAGDETDARGVRAGAATAIRDAAERLRVDDVVVVPESLLSVRAAAPEEAAAVLDGLASAVGDDGSFALCVAGFGWRYALDVRAKAHPFATEAQSVDPGDDPSSPEDASTPALESRYRVVLPNGDRVPPGAFLDRRDPSAGVARVIRATVPGLDDSTPAVTASGATAPSGESPPDRGDRARGLGVADHDPLDPGARFRPAGAFLRETLADAAIAVAADGVAGDAAVLPISGPRALDLGDDAVRRAAARLGDRGYGVPLGATRVLLDDVGATTALLALADAEVPRDALPLALRDRSAPATLPGTDESDASRAVSAAATAPAVHEAHATGDAARDAAVAHAERALAFADACGLDALAVASLASETDAVASGGDDAHDEHDALDAHDAHDGWLDSLAVALDAPVLVAVDPDAPAAWPVRVDVHAPAADGGTIATGSVRLDRDGPAAIAPDERDADSTPVSAVVHAAPAGALAATVAAVCDAPAAGPLQDWLAPTQVRVIPVADDLVDRALAVADDLAAAGVRVDVDDRALGVGERIAAAERVRVPRYVVVGDDELADDDERASGDEDSGADLPVTDVATGRTEDRGPSALAASIVDTVTRTDLDSVASSSGSECPLPRRLSRRPVFDDRGD